MASLFDQLLTCAGAAEPDLAGVLSALTTREATEVLNDAEVCIAHATRAFEQTDDRLRRLVGRLHGGGASLHRSGVDSVAVVASATWSYVRESGIYLPDELEELRLRGSIDRPWHSRESVRLAACLALVYPSVVALERERLTPSAYATQVRAHALELAEAPIGAVAG